MRQTLASLLVAPLLTLLAGSMVYCVLVVIGAARYRASRAVRPTVFPPISVLRPMVVVEDHTDANLRSVFEQHYEDFEVLLSVHDLSDPVVAIAQRAMDDYPGVRSRLFVAGTSPFPNAKVWSLRALLGEARHEVVVMSDSDTRLSQTALRKMVSELEQKSVGLVTCPFRAVSAGGFWGRLEALGRNTEFLAGVLAARLLNGMDFAIGGTIATRKSDLAAIGGLEALQNCVPEDFMLGRLMRKAGRKVILSRCVVGHYIGSEGMAGSWRRRVGRSRSTRRSRWGLYAGGVFTQTTAFALALWVVAPAAWGLALIGLMFRWCADWSAGIWVLNDPLVARYWWLLPIEGMAAFFAWVAGFFGKAIEAGDQS